ncbi:MAG TPA: hypothetical protein VEB21_06145 [Terriglobales bacterium]|nr:hypothetical protein [Terriglobales bacterium]
MQVDPAATLWITAIATARLAIAALPTVALLRVAPWQRRLWLLPLLAMVVIVSTPFSLASLATLDRWLLLLLGCAAATWMARRRWLWWTALLPFALLWEIVPSHGLLHFADVGTVDAEYRARLLKQCIARDGSRPANLTADHLMPYHGINPIDDDLVLLSGEGPNDGAMRGKSGGRRVGSWWLRRAGDGFRFEAPSDATGNLWRGCLIDGTVWMARANFVVGAQRTGDPPPRHEQVQRLRLPSNDIDYGETACAPERRRVYVTEVSLGGMWEISTDGSNPVRHEIGGIVLFPKRRFDGRLVLSDTASLTVFDPAAARVTERLAAGVADFGFDLCSANGAAAVADAAGRLRVFELDGSGHYRFAWGIELFAPRRVAYSTDCSRIAVTSADDRHVSIIDSATRSVVEVHRAGPALREVAATGPREFSIADVCTMTTYRW